MTELEKGAFFDTIRMRVKYGEISHLTTYRGAHDLLNHLLEKAGVIRDAKAAVLRAFEEQTLADNWKFPFEAGIITIYKVNV